MSTSFLPAIFVPFIGLVFPFVTLAYYLVYMEQNDID